MKWILIIFVFGYGDAIVPSMQQVEFDDRELCVTAKNYYESDGFKKRILDDINRSFLRIDVQCHQKNYPAKAVK